MAYVQHEWVTGEVITEALLDHLETQYDEGATDLTAHKTNSGAPGVHRWTANKLLLGAGAGANPTEVDLPVPTREFSLEFTYNPNGGATRGSIGYFSRWLLDAANEDISLSFLVPHDFTALTSCKVVGITGGGGGSGTIDWTADTNFAANTEAYTAHTDQATANALSTEPANNIIEIDISAAFTGLAANDKVGLKFKLDAVGDSGRIYVTHMEFKYT